MRSLNRIAVILSLLLVFAAAVAAAPAKEARGVWLSASTTAKFESAEQTAARLAAAGFNLVLPRYEANSEPLRALIAACHARHLEVHLWLFRPPVTMQEAWRCQSYNETKHEFTSGQGCLCDEQYLAANEELVRQIAREYEVEGLHFDEVGFGRPWQSLCDRCRQRFAADTGLPVADWPGDVIRLDKITRENRLDPAAWGGPHCQAFLHWRCCRLAAYLKRLRDAARSVRPLTISYAVMAELSADEMYYGEDLAELAKVFDFLVPMSYYTEYAGMSGGRPEWTAEVCRALADWAHRGNPDCLVYAGVSAYGADGGWREPIRDLYQKLVAAGSLTAEQQREHMKYLGCKQGLQSLQWLRDEGKITADEYERVRKIVEDRTPTSEELVRAVQSVRAAGLPGAVFFRYECMFEDRGQGVIGADLWDRLGELYREPATTPHAR